MGGKHANGHLVEKWIVEVTVEWIWSLHGKHTHGQLELLIVKACNVHVPNLKPVGIEHAVERCRCEAGAVGEKSVEREVTRDVGRGVEEVLEGSDGSAGDVEGVSR